MEQHTPSPAPARRRRATAWGAVVGALAVTGGVAGSAFAASAEPPAAAGSAVVSPAPPVDAAPGSAELPASQLEGLTGDYTADQYDAFWDAGYTAADADALAQLWATDVTSAKSRAGQALLDGAALPVAPGQTPEGPLVDGDPVWSAYSGAGYTYDDAVALAALWETDVTQAKIRIGQAVLDGQQLPVAPGSAPAAG